MRARRIGLAAVLTALALLSIRFDLVPKLRGPAPYPPEWQWRHRPHAIGRALPALPFAAALVGLLAWSGTAGAARRPRRTAKLLTAGALALGSGFSLALLAAEDGGPV